VSTETTGSPGAQSVFDGTVAIPELRVAIGLIVPLPGFAVALQTVSTVLSKLSDCVVRRPRGEFAEAEWGGWEFLNALCQRAARQARGAAHPRKTGGPKLGVTADGTLRAKKKVRKARICRAGKIMLKHSRPKPIGEQEAKSEIERVYHEIMQTMRVTGVNLNFRTWASWENFLPPLWYAMRPIVGTLAFEQAGDEVRKRTVSEMRALPTVTAFHRAGLGESQAFQVRAALRLYHYINRKLLVFTSAVRLGLVSIYREMPVTHAQQSRAGRSLQNALLSRSVQVWLREYRLRADGEAAPVGGELCRCSARYPLPPLQDVAHLKPLFRFGGECCRGDGKALYRGRADEAPLERWAGFKSRSEAE